jgi:hypothetical protein
MLALLVIPAKAGIYGAIGTGLRRCDEVDEALLIRVY